MHFGENYVQEAVAKITQLKEQTTDPVQWHFIGPVQSNKTKDIAQHFDWVQSVEREKIARRLNEQRPDDSQQLNLLLQVNIDDDDNKSGLAPEQVEALAEYVMNCPKLKLRGLMTILKAGTTEDERGKSFQQMYKLYQQLQQTYGEQIDTLSMGMSGDMRQAVLEGANMVRIGTAILENGVLMNDIRILPSLAQEIWHKALSAVCAKAVTLLTKSGSVTPAMPN